VASGVRASHRGTAPDLLLGIDLNAIPSGAVQRIEMRIGESAATVGMAAYNMEVPIGERSTFYSFGDFAHRFGKAAAFYRFPKQTS
jgi:hypothetical protein